MRILFNARIYTCNPEQTVVEALAIDNGRIVTAGSLESVKPCVSRGVEYVNLKGKTVLPGLTDAHIHLSLYAQFLSVLNCETSTRAECLWKVKNRTELAQPGEWIVGHGWNQNQWSEGFGNVHHLDDAAPRNPVFLSAKSLHAAWVNSAALALAGISAASPDPEGGMIGRFEDGKPNGLLFESAVSLFNETIPQPGLDELCRQMQTAQQTLLHMGITSVHDFDGPQCFSALQLMQAKNELVLRVCKNIPLEMLEHAIALGLRTGFGNNQLRIGSVKLFADGALGPRTAAMMEPYEGEKDNRGLLLLNVGQISDVAYRATSNGFSLAIHAIGDRANHTVLNAMEKIRLFEKENGYSTARHRIEHVQCLLPADQKRLSNLGIIASVQPAHATSDMTMANQYWGKRSSNAYAYQSLSTSGAVLAFGSDAPVENPNPFFGLHAAVTRCRRDASPGVDGWHPEQRMSLQEALAGFTYGPAYAAGLENQFGRLAAGYRADLIILDENPFDMPVERLHQLSPSGVMIDGEWVFCN